MKLSLYSQRVRNGARNEDVYNPNEMRRKLFDVKIEGVLKLSPDNKGMLHMLAVNPMGCMVFVIKPLFTRMGDYRALVLAVPRQVVFTAARDLPAIVGDMERILAEEKDDGTQQRWAPLAKWFDTDYPETDFEWPLAEGGDRYAYRTCNGGQHGGTMASLLGTAMLQDYYADYEGVFLLTAAQATLVRENAMSDITKKTLVTPAIVRPPKHLPKGVGLFAGKKEIAAPVLSHLGAKMRLTLKKEHCADMTVEHKVAETDSTVALPQYLEWDRKIPVSALMLIGEDNRQIRNANCRIDIVEATAASNKNFIVIPERLMQKAHVTVAIDGYEPCNAVVDFTKATKENPLRLTLRKSRSKVKYKVAGSEVTFEMVCTDDAKGDTPLPGYVVDKVDGNVVTLKKKGGSDGKKKSRKEEKKWNFYRIGVGLLVGLVLGFAAGWLPGVSHGVDKRNGELEKEREAQALAEQQRADSLQRVRIVAFLDSVPSWKKEQFDSVFGGKLSTLYHDVNYFRFEQVQQQIEEMQIEGSKQIALLDSVIKLMNSRPEYMTQLQQQTKNENESHQKFFSADGSITLTNLFAHLEAARKKVDEMQKP